MSNFINIKEKNKLYLHIKHELGYPLRPFEITDEMLDSYLQMALEDYSSVVNQWLIEQQWINLQNLNIDKGDFFNAFITKSNDFIESFTYAYSKQVGLGTNAPAARGWELKRDFIIITGGTQHYIIPKNRELNEVLWETPPSIDQGLIDPFALSNWTAGQFGWSYLGRPAQYIQPTYSLLLAAQDRRMKQRILQSELTYRITGLESGEKLLHLYPIPGSRYEIRSRFGKHFNGTKVWYWYYDTDKNNKENCINENPDIVKLPSDVPIENLKWENLNTIAKRHVRDLLIGKVKMIIGGIRGFYSGDVSSTDAKQLTMDYRHLLEEGEKLRENILNEIKESLDKISIVNLTRDRADVAENVNRAMGYQPFRNPFITL